MKRKKVKSVDGGSIVTNTYLRRIRTWFCWEKKFNYGTTPGATPSSKGAFHVGQDDWTVSCRMPGIQHFCRSWIERDTEVCYTGATGFEVVLFFN
jgi:hypothetical protein